MQADRPAEISAHVLATAPLFSSSLPMGSSPSKSAEPSVAAKVRRVFAGRRKRPADPDADARSLSLTCQVPPVDISPSSASSPVYTPSPYSYPKHKALPSLVSQSQNPSDGVSQPEKQVFLDVSRTQAAEHTSPPQFSSDPGEFKRIERSRARSESEGLMLDREHADKRKSDSTISHCTIRPGAAGPRSSRPVSMAESFQSTYTIVPGGGASGAGVVMVNKRLSAVDIDLGMLEEDDDSFQSFDDIQEQRGSVVVREKLPSPLLNLKRRSMSLNIGFSGGNSSNVFLPHFPPAPSATDLKHPSHSISEGFYRHPTSTLSSLATSLSNQPHRHQPNKNQNIAPMPPNVNASFAYPTQRPLPNSPTPPSFRQTAVSISSSFAPAGLARKAVEKVKGALGHMGHHCGSASGSISSVSTSSVSGCSSSASVSSATPSSFPHEFGVLNLSRTPSNQSCATHHTHSSSMHAVNIKEIKERQQHQNTANKKGKKFRRTPGTYSVGSVSITSCSDDAFMSSDPVLGMLLRGPLRNRSGAPATSGVVFQRNLTRCVRDTAVWVGKKDMGSQTESERGEPMGRPELLIHERRMLPALVVRCAQHLLVWGVQEEGLFRVPGRAAHITKLRTEFDTGVDYNMSGCAPGDLDPHAVASVFKAYLRELPENILTQKLLPYFDAAIEREGSNASAADSEPPQLELKKDMGPSSIQKLLQQHKPTSSTSSAVSSSSALPTLNLRKPPSLSTFTLPSLDGIRPASHALISTLWSLIAKMPKENRDLLRTVVELVRATAEASKLTKMPLGNLLMVFLPSLNISAQLFRVLCEEERVWTGLVDVLEDEHGSGSEPEARRVGMDELLDVQRSTVFLRTNSDPRIPKGDGEAMSKEEEDDDDEYEEADEHRRWTVVNRSEIPTVYLDSRSQASSASVASSGLASSSREPSNMEGSISKNDLSSVSASIRPARGEETLSSSVESILTPLTPSAQSSAAYLPFDALDTVRDLSGRNIAYVTNVGPRIQVVEPASVGLEIGVERDEGKVRRLAISNPLPYISTSTPPPSSTTTSNSVKNVPPSPASFSAKRLSIPTLSFPNLLAVGSRNLSSPVGSAPVSPAGSLSSAKGQPPSLTGLRTKKPSLKLLFSKKSAGSLNNGMKYTNAVNGSPRSEQGSAHGSAGSFMSQQLKTASMVLATGSCSSDSSVSTPVSAVTAPGASMGSFKKSTSTLNLPPVLDASFEEEPPLRQDLGLEVSPPSTAKPPQAQKKERVKTMVGQTPIADWYSTKNAASSVSDLTFVRRQQEGSRDEEGFDVDIKRTVIESARSSSVSSKTSLNHLGVYDDDSVEDWTRSVLLAADVELASEKTS